ncbi:MAG: zf-HC2 domain-containing protein [Myxococcales bacterium]
MCKDIYALATDYQERRLPWSKRLQFRLHLYMCDACTTLLVQLARTRVLLGKLRGPVLGKEEERELLSRLRSPKPPAS